MDAERQGGVEGKKKVSGLTNAWSTQKKIVSLLVCETSDCTCVKRQSVRVKLLIVCVKKSNDVRFCSCRKSEEESYRASKSKVLRCAFQGRW
jgi:hypothetical protein